MIDSGGFASLFKHSRVEVQSGLGVIEIDTEDGEERIDPASVLDLQERLADVAFTLDFPIPPRMDKATAHRRMELTIANAHWALENRRRRDLPLYACVQAADADNARVCARAYRDTAFDGTAIGGLVPRARDPDTVIAIVKAVRNELPDRPLHVFGLGKPELVRMLFEAGVDSVDSSAYVKLAADGRLWSNPEFHLADPSPTERLHLALCNLAVANGETLPLSLAGVVFSTELLTATEHPKTGEDRGDYRTSWHESTVRAEFHPVLAS